MAKRKQKKSKKKKRVLSPRRKRMNRHGRLQSAPHWIPKYEGKNIVRGYRNHFGVNSLTAAIELQMLGVEIDPDYMEQLKQIARAEQTRAKRKKAKEREDEMLSEDADGRFAFIAGYTSGGMPYGITWEEIDEDPEADE